jgi:hypothetical protein
VLDLWGPASTSAAQKLHECMKTPDAERREATSLPASPRSEAEAENGHPTNTEDVTPNMSIEEEAA